MMWIGWIGWMAGMFEWFNCDLGLEKLWKCSLGR